MLIDIIIISISPKYFLDMTEKNKDNIWNGFLNSLPKVLTDSRILLLPKTPSQSGEKMKNTWTYVIESNSNINVKDMLVLHSIYMPV